MEKFEYKTLLFEVDSRYRIDESKFQEELNELGEQGWELVSTTLYTEGTPGRTYGYLSILKRKI